MEMILLAFTWLEGVYLFCFVIGLGFVVVTFMMGVGGHEASGHEGVEGGVDHEIGAADHEIAVGDHDFGVGDHDFGVGDHDFGAGDHELGGVDHDVSVDHDLGGSHVDLSQEAGPGLDVHDHSLAHEADAGDSAAAEHAESFHAGYGEAVGGFRLGPLSPTVISLVLCCFGGTGMLLIYSGLMSGEPWRYVSLVPSLFSGVVLGTVMMLGFNRIFSSIEASSEVTVGSLIGHEATVTTPIPADGVGEIVTTARGARWTGAARSANGQAIGKYEKVVIQERRRHVCYVLPAEKKPQES